MQFQLRTQTFRGLPVRDDDALGERLAGLVESALDRGGAPLAAVAARDERVDLLLVGDLLREKISPAWFLGALTNSEVPGEGPAVSVGVVGAATLRRVGSDEPGVPVAVVFLEWSDGRWWHWQGLLSPGERRVRDETVTLRRAVDGDPKPRNLGGWWRLARLRNLGLRFEPRVN